MELKPTDYKGIKLWGEHLGSFEYYIESEQARAAHVQAPVDALYYDPNEDKWICVSDLHSKHRFRDIYLRGTK
jgi:hypothetical protein